MITNVYIDGFNLYYGALKGTRYKWLNPLELCRLTFGPTNTYHRVRYFTALVSNTAWDRTKKARQEFYLRALLTLRAKVPTDIHYGKFLTHSVSMPLANTPSQKATVIKTEEKGSDVNLASYLLFDGFKGDYDCAIVVSNDSDLVEPINLVRRELQLRVLVLNPHRKKPSHDLKRAATLFKTVREADLQNSQFPSQLNDSSGRTIRKPSRW